MKLRFATEQDLPEILEIYRPYVEQTAITFEYEVPVQAEFLQRFRDTTSRCPWLVCEKDGIILGYAYVDRAFARAAYSWAADLAIYLRMGANGCGIGGKLYRLLERMTAAQGYHVLYGLITSDNETSCRFHEHMGYRKTAYLPDCGFKLGKWYGVTWYEKRLCPHVQPSAFPTPAPHMNWSELDLSDLRDTCEITLK